MSRNRFLFLVTSFTFTYYCLAILLIDFVGCMPVRLSSKTAEEIGKERFKRQRDHFFLQQGLLKDESGLQNGEPKLTWDLQRVYSSNYPKLNIPKYNPRQVHIYSVEYTDPMIRAKKVFELFLQISTKKPVFENKLELQKRELKLLSMGLIAQCLWAVELPPPFNDKQCSVKELDSVIKQICYDAYFEGLPPCLTTTESMEYFLYGGLNKMFQE